MKKLILKLFFFRILNLLLVHTFAFLSSLVRTYVLRVLPLAMFTCNDYHLHQMSSDGNFFIKVVLSKFHSKNFVKAKTSKYLKGLCLANTVDEVICPSHNCYSFSRVCKDGMVSHFLISSKFNSVSAYSQTARYIIIFKMTVDNNNMTLLKEKSYFLFKIS